MTTNPCNTMGSYWNITNLNAALNSVRSAMANFKANILSFRMLSEHSKDSLEMQYVLACSPLVSIEFIP